MLAKHSWQTMTTHRLTQIEDYEPFIGMEAVERIRRKAAPFRGCKVANFNSTYYGGGVAEMLSSLTLLMNSLGIKAEWRVIAGTPLPRWQDSHAVRGCRADVAKIVRRD